MFAAVLQMFFFLIRVAVQSVAFACSVFVLVRMCLIVFFVCFCFITVLHRCCFSNPLIFCRYAFCSFSFPSRKPALLWFCGCRCFICCLPTTSTSFMMFNSFLSVLSWNVFLVVAFYYFATFFNNLGAWHLKRRQQTSAGNYVYNWMKL